MSTVGICLSGGGIRSASYSLGALQALQRAGILSEAKYLSAVSGGSYIAGAMALVARGPMTKEDEEAGVLAPPDPFAPGSPEERYLRNHTLYISHGPGGTIGSLCRAVLGISFNMLFVGLFVFFLARPLGWLYGWAFEELRSKPPQCVGAACDVNVSQPGWLLRTLGGVALFSVLLAVVNLVIRWRSDSVRRSLSVLSIALVTLAGVVFLFTTVLPELLELIRDVLGKAKVEDLAVKTESQVSADEGNSRSGRWLTGIGGVGLAGVLGTVLFSLRASFRDPEQLKKTGTWIGKQVRPGLARLRGPLLNLVATVVGPLLLVCTFLAFLNWGAARVPGAAGGGGSGEVLLFGLVVAVLALLHWLGDLVSWSLHPVYKRRLSRAFALCRFSRPDPDDPSPTKEEAEERPYTRWYRLSDSQPSNFPELLICAAANVSDYGKTPAGANVTSFVFSASEIGGPQVRTVETAEFEKAVGDRGRDITLMTAVAITGAAFSPSMGKMTRKPLRFLMALANLRLGVWVPNPQRVEAFAKKRRLYRMRPRPHYLFRELFGWNRFDAPFFYVSDGGHYENLGLVELLRRRCTEVWCVDAAGDKMDTFNTIGEAIAIARAEHVVEDIHLDPSAMAPDPNGDPRFARKTHEVGSVLYPDGTTATLVFVKAAVTKDAPWDVRSFYGRHPVFPSDPTLNQLYDAERFDAYRVLGAFQMERAVLDMKHRATARTTCSPQTTAPAVT